MLHVKITDVNDNAPKFFNFTTDTTHDVSGSSTSGSIYVMENTTVGTKIFHFHTVDLDEGENGNVTYWIDWNAIYGDLSQQNIQSIVSKYTLNPVNGELRVSSELDYENEYERKVVMLIQAVDNGLPRLTSSLSFTVNLLDINDNDPEIEMQQTQSNTTGYNEGYAQETGNDLPLLYENNPNSQLLRLLSIKDKDNCSVNKITCQLIDEEENRKNFRLISYSNYAYGLLNQREFDYEKDTNANGNLLAGIQCHDLAEPPKLIKKWFEIPLGDLNDNWPQFNQTNYAFYLYENVPINTQIGQIYATDLDSGINGKLVYELMSDNLELLNLIKIDSKTGILYTSGLLDRELISVLNFLVTVTDCDGGEGGSVAYHNERENSNLKLSIKTNTTSLKIHLLDVNDNPPKYIGPLEIHVEENFPIGTEILNRLNYIDPDLEENSTITVKLLDRSSLYSSSKLQDKYAAFHHDNEGSHSSFITVDNKLRLIVSGPLDRENQAQFILTLIAFDHGKVVSQTSTTTVTVFVDDTNDNEPQLLYPRNASLLFGMSESSGWLNSLSTSTVPADTPFGTLIATIRGKDPDAGENGTVIYSVVPSKVYHLQQQIMKQPPEQHHTGSLDGKYSNRIKNSKSNIKVDGKRFENEEFVKIHDGFFYFTIDEQTGQLTTFWGNDMKEVETSASASRKHSTNSNKSSSGKYSIDKTYDKKNKLTKRLKSRGQPTPGLYLISVNLQDKGVPQHNTEAIFYVNISEPIGDHFGFWTLHDSNMSNTIILILIIVCSLALIISLTAAILWVRFRSDNQMSRPTSNGAYKQGTLITTDPHNPNMNCEFYHSGSLSPVGDIRYEKAYINSNGSTFISPDVVASHSKWNETMFDCCVPTDYTTSGGYCGGTMLTGTLINSSNQKLSGYIQPCYSSEDSNQSAIHLYPIHMSESSDAYNGMTVNRNTIDRNEWMSTMGKYCNLHQNVTSATTPLMINPSDAQVPNLVRIDPFVNRIDLCGKNSSQMMNIGSTSCNLPNTVILGNHNNNNNNNSTGGSDSGVDSGAGIIITTESYLPLSSSSPIKDPGEMKHNVINCNGLLDNSVTPPPLVSGHDHTTTIINTTKIIDDSSINEQYGIITFSPKNAIKPSEQMTRQQMHNFPRLNI
uniref:Cadherin domain-containing protein n=1 Tax=Trichobilharzia regenti TaxID=157069 RepID=A0AA85KIH7_TRIRE|nr:unnamed protein product [Trichobilharzia regenti]